MIPTYLLPSVARAECAGLVVSTGALPRAWRHLITLVSGWAGQGAGQGLGRTTASIYRDRVRRRVIP